MDERRQQGAIEAISKLSRTAALFLGFSLVFGLLLIFEQTSPGNLGADITQVQTGATPSATAEFLQTSFSERYQIALEEAFGQTPGSEAFLADVARWSTIADVRIHEAAGGVYVSVLATTRGDSLHEYFGFFRKDDDEVTEIIWSGLLPAQSRGNTLGPSGEYRLFTLVNSGKVPWLADDAWKDEISGQELILLPEDGSKIVAPERSGTFVGSRTSETIVPKNATRGYLLQIQQ